MNLLKFLASLMITIVSGCFLFAWLANAAANHRPVDVVPFDMWGFFVWLLELVGIALIVTVSARAAYSYYQKEF